jgi:hypothetical protein
MGPRPDALTRDVDIRVDVSVDVHIAATRRKHAGSRLVCNRPLDPMPLDEGD